jgi:hypothetical protein
MSENSSIEIESEEKIMKKGPAIKQIDRSSK